MNEPKPDPATTESHYDVMILAHEQELAGVVVAQAYLAGGTACFHSHSGL
jgi:hypothetical protein